MEQDLEIAWTLDKNIRWMRHQDVPFFDTASFSLEHRET